VIKKIVTGALPAMPDELPIPKNLQRLLRQCWIAAPEQRPTIRECASELDPTTTLNDEPSGILVNGTIFAW
jgi:hypothetical protein